MYECCGCKSGEKEAATSEVNLRTLKNGEEGAYYKSSYSWKMNIPGVISYSFEKNCWGVFNDALIF
jgi:hypothetical protein